jgi:hypothetical protein
MQDDETLRPLATHERDLVRAMLSFAFPEYRVFAAFLDTAQVMDMRGGGMGSIRFNNPSAAQRTVGRTIARAEYTDEDGVLVSIALHADEKGDLFELDCWKVDFSRLRRYPSPSAIHFGPI